MEESQPLPGELPDAVDLEPLSVRSVRGVIAQVTQLTNAGHVDSITVVTITPDNEYQIFNSIEKDRHEVAGLLIEAALKRLGFAKLDESEEPS